jgi:hypothetical protein
MTLPEFDDCPQSPRPFSHPPFAATPMMRISTRPLCYSFVMLVPLAIVLSGAGESRLDAAAPKPATKPAPVARPAVLLTDADWRNVPRRAVSARQIDKLLTQSSSANEAAPQTTDEQFLRRASLDLTGTLPSPEKLVQFVADSDSTKRSKLIDELLASDAYARHWARFWRDVVSARLTLRRSMGLTRSFEEWLFERFRAGDDWRTITRAMLTAEGKLRFTLNQPGAENGQLFFLVAHDGPEAEERAAETSRVFLGIQIQCAQCHDHPTENWKRTQFHEFAAYFARIKYEQLFDAGKLSGVQLVGLKNAEHKVASLTNPDDFSVTQPRFLNGIAPGKELGDRERRHALAEAVVADDNYWFAAAFVNRVWNELMGWSFYPHVDDLGPMKEVVEPQVLQALVGSFQASGYDPRSLIRTIAETAAYQRGLNHGSTPGATWTTTSRRLRPDTLWDSLVHVFGKIEAGARFHTGGGVRFNTTFVEGKFRNEFDFDPSLDADEVNGTIPQALFLMNNPTLNGHIAAARTSVLGRLLREHKDDAAAVDALYRLTLARSPSAGERRRCLSYIAESSTREEAFEDLLWTLINCTEFQRTR